MSNLDRYKDDLVKLIKLGEAMDADLMLRHFENEGKLSDEQKAEAEKLRGDFERDYQRWFTESSAVIKQLIPDRYAEFENLYKGEGKRKEISQTTYSIQDWLNGIRSENNGYGKKHFDDFAATSMRLKTQLAILKSVASRFKSTLFDIRQLVQADLFDSELDSSRELLKHGFLRAAGAIAGVVLEAHLTQVAINHNITNRKANPSISDLNDLLKAGGVLETPPWRQIQRLGDIRNLCAHNKEREPANDEVNELIDGVEKFTKTLF